MNTVMRVQNFRKHILILNKIIRIDFIEKVKFEQKVNHAETCGDCIMVSCKDLERDTCHMYLGNIKNTTEKVRVTRWTMDIRYHHIWSTDMKCFVKN
jgi:hypothetical protein